MSQTVVEIVAADGVRIPAYVARPAGKPRGGLVVVQEIFGVNRHIRAVADGYAADGYLAVAPSIFHRVQPNVELGYREQDLATGFGYKQKVDALPAPGVQQDLQAAIDWAAQESGGKVGVVGYCWGGLLSWRAACGLKGLAAAITYYGGGMTTPEEAARQPKVPYCHTLPTVISTFRCPASRHSNSSTLKSRCTSTAPTTASIATCAARGTPTRPNWRANARWRFWASMWDKTSRCPYHCTTAARPIDT